MIAITLTHDRPLDDYEKSAELPWYPVKGIDDVCDSLFSPGMNDAPRIRMYRSWVFPGLYPNEPQPVLSNWHPEDIAAYCGRI